ncbi:DEAD/DEAH box helicase [Gallaecimonas sp. GXIMD4217]|uniref:DEAD/DEAH box helicase n=1 Tax=Gallaecimonas sp. GXIMD4217 TaxID=3131927 RepID=UPI00311B33D9
MSASLMRALADLGFETPSPIQSACIPHLLDGRDVLGIAQTGTGKTAAFALPLLNNIDLERREPQLLILAPTRELAIQVAKACEDFGRHMPGLNVATIYGGSPFGPQRGELRRGAQVVVGTPGRMLDHIRRETLMLENIQAVVLDEADEMLRMGFIEDVETILAETPESRQTALFSATLPPVIRRLVERFLKNHEEVRIKAQTQTVERIAQLGLMTFEEHKPAVLARVLEAEDFDAAIIFARTKESTLVLSERLNRLGIRSAALNGDLGQKDREQAVEALRAGKLDVVVATDVAARGLDVERIGLVVNYDIPREPEAYVHRIGRTGRAGREGRAIVLFTPRERHLLGRIERVTRQKVEIVELPSREALYEKRLAKLRDRLEAKAVAIDEEQQALASRLQAELSLSPEALAAALLALQADFQPLEVDADPKMPNPNQRREERGPRQGRDRFERNGDRRGQRFERGGERGERRFERDGDRRPRKPRDGDVPMESYRLEVGRNHGATPRHIVGAIANEANLDSRHIGQIRINDDHSTVMLPKDMPKQIEHKFQKVFICQRPMKLRRQDAA